MKKFFKVLWWLFIAFLIIALIFITFVVAEGYSIYKDAINEISITDKVEEIRNNEDFYKLANLPQMYKDAVIAVEDHRFEDHNGIDIIATGRAILNNIIAFDIVEGGSTITQQLAKNMYFTGEERFTRKVAELFVAFDLEKQYSKDYILELYVNTIYFGDGYYGVKQASIGYFDKLPYEMTDYESTLLAGIPNAPSVYSLTTNPELAKQRQAQVLYCLVKYGYISQTEADKILNSKEVF